MFYFSEHIWVHCPKCSELALIETVLPKYTIPFPRNHKSVCDCKSCGFKDSKNEMWHGYFQGSISRACGHCGSRVNHTTEPTREIYKASEIACEVCKNVREYELNWLPYRKEMATDPFFGLDIWLQLNIKNQLLWLYNMDHLNYLKEYVEATLRDEIDRHKYSMIANLPQWVKSSKNRELIVKKLNKLGIEFERNNACSKTVY